MTPLETSRARVAELAQALADERQKLAHLQAEEDVRLLEQGQMRVVEIERLYDCPACGAKKGQRCVKRVAMPHRERVVAASRGMA
jgi:hypothetical protein